MVMGDRYGEVMEGSVAGMIQISETLDINVRFHWFCFRAIRLRTVLTPRIVKYIWGLVSHRHILLGSGVMSLVLPKREVHSDLTLGKLAMQAL
jgi:hypothetical protein